MVRYGMVIDLNTCVGCNACTIACKTEYATPHGIFYCMVLEKETGKYPNAKRIYVPVLCNHCTEAPCVDVCPTGASHKRKDIGIVLIDHDKCIGCGACIVACPYKQRFRNPGNQQYYEEGLTPYENLVYTKLEKGVVYKCNFCIDRLDKGLEPSCVQSCPTDCRVFGDFDDPKSKITKMIRERNASQLLPELGTDGGVYYVQ
jgi:molybdopterin-containing oxidoreductase family iron-sulfur binding subunit